MPIARVNDIDLNYRLEGDGEETIVLVNGLADDLETVPFFTERGDELGEFETAMRYMDQPVHAYLAQLAVIQDHDTAGRLGDISVPALVLAGEEDILIPVSLSRRIHEGIPGSEWATTKGGHACAGSTPPNSTRPSSPSSGVTASDGTERANAVAPSPPTPTRSTRRRRRSSRS